MHMIVSTTQQGLRKIKAFCILSVSPFSEDHATLEQIVREGAPDGGADSTWRLCRASTLSAAIGILNRLSCPVIICERDLPPDSWKDLLEYTQRLANPPSVIVSSRLADEWLWAEALNLGAYDVLAKPFDRTEIVRVVSLAGLRWWRHAVASPTRRASPGERLRLRHKHHQD
jgi:DNA-binding response OmpR family regulator